MTMLNLEAIKARLAAATPGPWEWKAQSGGYWYALIAADNTEVIDDGSAGGEYDGRSPDSPNAAFIAAAPSDVAALVAEVERLRGAMAADDARLRDAEARVWPEMTHGCDAPAALADEVLRLRAWGRDVLEHKRRLFDDYGRTMVQYIDARNEAERLRDALHAIIADQEARYQPFDEAAQLAREGLGLPRLEPPPPDVAMTELRARFGHHFDGFDAEAFVREMRDDA